MAERLRDQAGVTRWPQLAAATDEQLQAYGIAPRDWPHLRAAAARLTAGQAVTRLPLNQIMLRGLSAMSIEFASAGTPAGTAPPPEALWLENPAAAPTRIGIASDGTADLAPVVGRTPVVVYGATELAVTYRLLRAAGAQGAQVIDLLTLIEDLVHAPLQGLELSQVSEYVQPTLRSPADGPGRLAAMRAVINWLAGESGTAA